MKYKVLEDVTKEVLMGGNKSLMFAHVVIIPKGTIIELEEVTQ